MNELVERLNQLSSGVSPGMSFRTDSEQASGRAVLLGLEADDIADYDPELGDFWILPADTVGKIKSTDDDDQVIRGVALSGAESEAQLTRLGDAALTFILARSDEVPAKVLNLSEELAFGYKLSEGLTDNQCLAIEDTDFTFLTTTLSGQGGSFSLARILDLKSRIAHYSQHIFLELDFCPTDTADLEVLRDVPVSAIILQYNKRLAKEVKQLSQTLSQVEPRKNTKDSTRPLANLGL